MKSHRSSLKPLEGAIALGVAANELATYAGEFIGELQPTISLGLGADHKPNLDLGVHLQSGFLHKRYFIS
ncbi:hypothetical protein NIES2111_21680 [Nostoc sp. NIES-2111]|nr:hypothetical protein NIES2111_21680 [Nostoc sp. NIES-2111]